MKIILKKHEKLVLFKYTGVFRKQNVTFKK